MGRGCSSRFASTRPARSLTGRRACPSLERMRKRAEILEAQQPGDLTDREAFVLEIPARQVTADDRQQFRKAGALLAEMPRQRSRAQSETVRDGPDARLAVRQQRGDLVL